MCDVAHSYTMPRVVNQLYPRTVIIIAVATFMNHKTITECVVMRSSTYHSHIFKHHTYARSRRISVEQTKWKRPILVFICFGPFATRKTNQTPEKSCFHENAGSLYGHFPLNVWLGVWGTRWRDLGVCCGYVSSADDAVLTCSYHRCTG